jgi:DNA-binding winged helix-turn-helix (wHTH) protein
VPGSETTRIVRFGIFELDLQSGELRRNGLKVKLQEQPFQILALLLEHPPGESSREKNYVGGCGRLIRL